MARNYHEEVQRALARQRAASESHDKRALNRAAATRLPASILSVSDIADVVTNGLTSQRHEILEHVGRMLKLIEMKRSAEDLRARNLHERLCVLESQLRRMTKGVS